MRTLSARSDVAVAPLLFVALGAALPSIILSQADSFADNNTAVSSSPGQNGSNVTKVVYEGEERVMVELLDAWRPYTWPKPENLSSPLGHCAWDGIACNPEGRVQRIRLTTRDIEGTIPPQIAQLSQLEHLYLFQNFLRGTIPSELGRFPHLTHLSLGENKLVGTIPSTLGNLKTLKYLYLNGNQLRGNIPAEIGKLSALQHLALWTNRLEGHIPDMFGDMSELDFVWLNTNTLTGTIPPSLAALQKLKYLYVSGNANLSGTVPVALAKSPALEGLYLSWTNITGALPCELGKMLTIKKVDAEHSQVIGCRDLSCLQTSQECQDASPQTESGPQVEL